MQKGGEPISLPPTEPSAMMELLASAGEDVAKKEPVLAEAYKILTGAARRDR
jgi:hypothetical protein